MTVLEIIQRSSAFLARKGVDSPRLQVELLLAHVLQVPRLRLYLNFERSLTGTELETVRSLVQRRGERKPLQHLLGSACFCGLDLQVNADVLVPRPETELLAERAGRFLSSLQKPAVILDFGTGSGCVAIALAVRFPTLQAHAVDVSEAALRVARENAARHEVSDRIRFYASDGCSSLASGARFDLLVSNPPYIPSAEIGTLQPEVRDHDPRVALDGGDDGLNFYRMLAAAAPPWLAAQGRAMLEFGDGQGGAVSGIFARERWTIEALEKDYSGRERILIACRPDY